MKKVSAFIAFALLYTGSSSCLAQEQEIVIATGEWSPFISETLPEGGPYAKVVRDFFSAKNIGIRIEFTNWKRAYELTKSGGYAGSFAWFRTPERESDTLLGQRPVAIAENVVFHKASLTGQDLSSLEKIATSGLKIVGVGGYWYESELTKLNAKLETVGNLNRAFAMLAGNRADLLIETKEVGIVEGEEILGKEVMATIVYSGSIKTDELLIAFSRTHREGTKLHQIWDAQ